MGMFEPFTVKTHSMTSFLMGKSHSPVNFQLFVFHFFDFDTYPSSVAPEGETP